MEANFPKWHFYKLAENPLALPHKVLISMELIHSYLEKKAPFQSFSSSHHFTLEWAFNFNCDFIAWKYLKGWSVYSQTIR